MTKMTPFMTKMTPFMPYSLTPKTVFFIKSGFFIKNGNLKASATQMKPDSLARHHERCQRVCQRGRWWGYGYPG